MRYKSHDATSHGYIVGQGNEQKTATTSETDTTSETANTTSKKANKIDILTIAVSVLAIVVSVGVAGWTIASSNKASERADLVAQTIAANAETTAREIAEQTVNTSTAITDFPDKVKAAYDAINSAAPALSKASTDMAGSAVGIQQSTGQIAVANGEISRSATDIAKASASGAGSLGGIESNTAYLEMMTEWTKSNAITQAQLLTEKQKEMQDDFLSKFNTYLPVISSAANNQFKLPNTAIVYLGNSDRVATTEDGKFRDLPETLWQQRSGVGNGNTPSLSTLQYGDKLTLLIDYTNQSTNMTDAVLLFDFMSLSMDIPVAKPNDSIKDAKLSFVSVYGQELSEEIRDSVVASNLENDNMHYTIHISFMYPANHDNVSTTIKYLLSKESNFLVEGNETIYPGSATTVLSTLLFPDDIGYEWSDTELCIIQTEIKREVGDRGQTVTTRTQYRFLATLELPKSADGGNTSEPSRLNFPYRLKSLEEIN